MALKGQRFELDLEADDFTANLIPPDSEQQHSDGFVVKEIQERDPTGVPPPPAFKPTRTGFPEHKKRFHGSASKQSRSIGIPELSIRSRGAGLNSSDIPTQVPPSDRAIAHHISRKYGFDPETKAKTEISEENKRRIAEMSTEDLEEARSELVANLSPAFIERLLQKANIDEDGPSKSPTAQKENRPVGAVPASTDTEISHNDSFQPNNEIRSTTPDQPTTLSIHFPLPPRDATSYKPLDHNSSTFLADLKTQYFPNTPHEPSSLSWLHDPSEDDLTESPYNPNNPSYAPSHIRFSFTGRLIPPRESLIIPVEKGLHHHGDAPASAGYTIPELGLLCRSTLLNQRCIAYEILGRILYRLGRGDFGPRGSDLQEGLWGVIEKERVVEVMLHDANRDGGHVSAKAHATEALWLWRKGGGGDRGLLRANQTVSR